MSYQQALDKAVRDFSKALDELRDQHAVKAILDGWPFEALVWAQYPHADRWDLKCGETLLASIRVDFRDESGPVIRHKWVGPAAAPVTPIES